ncbi:MAG TPA: sigma-70 family RNA polymerase sigma factor [Methylomirabilota bacterium]
MAAVPEERDPGERRAKSLGELLHADTGASGTSEKEWAELVRSVAARDQRALHALYERTHRLVFTLTVRILGNRQTAEEVTLDVFHDVWRRAGTYDPANGSVVGWIMNQARSRAIDRLRFEQRKKRVGDSADSSPPAIPATDPAAAVDARQEADVLRVALTCLTPDERQVVEAAFFGELTYQEVASKLNQPLGTVKTRIRSALGKLRDALGEAEKGR